MAKEIDWHKPVTYLREQVIDLLRFNHSENHLTNDEFEKRINTAYQTEEKDELKALLTDLPLVEPSAINVQKDYDMVTSIFFGQVKTGRWVPARKLDITSIFGGAYIDFRKADLKSENITVNLTNIFGVSTVIIPPNVNLILNKVSIVGGTLGRSTQEPIPGAPTIEIHGTSIFGGAKVSIKTEA